MEWFKEIVVAPKWWWVRLLFMVFVVGMIVTSIVMFVSCDVAKDAGIRDTAVALAVVGNSFLGLACIPIMIWGSTLDQMRSETRRYNYKYVFIVAFICLLTASITAGVGVPWYVPIIFGGFGVALSVWGVYTDFTSKSQDEYIQWGKLKTMPNNVILEARELVRNLMKAAKRADEDAKAFSSAQIETPGSDYQHYQVPRDNDKRANPLLEAEEKQIATNKRAQAKELEGLISQVETARQKLKEPTGPSADQAAQLERLEAELDEKVKELKFAKPSSDARRLFSEEYDAFALLAVAGMSLSLLLWYMFHRGQPESVHPRSKTVYVKKKRPTFVKSQRPTFSNLSLKQTLVPVNEH